MLKFPGKLFPLFVASMSMFVAERSAQANQWYQFNPPGTPTAATFAVVNGENIVTLGPSWYLGEDGGLPPPAGMALFMLTNKKNPNGDGDFNLQSYQTGYGWSGVTELYYQGIVSLNSGFFSSLIYAQYVGWTALGNLYWSPVNHVAAIGVTSFAQAGTTTPFDNPFGIQTSSRHSCPGPYQQDPTGWCIYGATDDNLTTWTSWGAIGASQVTVDTETGVPWFLDNVGKIWRGDQSPPVMVTESICNDQGGSLGSVFQIAAKNSTAYALAIYDAGVYVLNNNASCWTALPEPDGNIVLSIATDNNAPNQAHAQVWASDITGKIWYYSSAPYTYY